MFLLLFGLVKKRRYRQQYKPCYETHAMAKTALYYECVSSMRVSQTYSALSIKWSKIWIACAHSKLSRHLWLTSSWLMWGVSIAWKVCTPTTESQPVLPVLRCLQAEHMVWFFTVSFRTISCKLARWWTLGNLATATLMDPWRLFFFIMQIHYKLYYDSNSFSRFQKLTLTSTVAPKPILVIMLSHLSIV